MNPIEKTIRSALEKGDAEDRAFREKVYRSVHAALEKNLQANPELSADAVQRRRMLLTEGIRSVESEFVPAAPADPAPPSNAGSPSFAAPDWSAPEAVEPDTRGTAPEPAPHAGTVAEDDDASVLGFVPERGGVSRGRAEPAFSAGGMEPGAEDGFVAERADRPQDRRAPTAAPRRRRPVFAALFLVVTLLVAGGMAAWWAMDQGLFLSAEERDTSVPNPPLTLEDEEFSPDGPPPLSESEAAAEGTQEWIGVFDPADPTQVVTPPGADAAVVEEEGAMVLRIRTTSTDEPIRFQVGEGILQRIAGRRAVFNIVARTRDGETAQIAVGCDFGPLGGCGRNRYSVTGDEGDFLLGREFPDSGPTGAGEITISTDPETGRSVDIVEIRVTADG